MDHSRVSLFWDQPTAVGGFSTAVCLHGHTMHSEECLSFLPRYLHGVPGISRIVRGYQRGPRPAVDFSRAYWTPPLTPASALRLERQQIANLGLRPLVSLTDHDNIDAGLGLEDEPVSVEWTVPYERSMLHLGIHNLPPHSARSWMSLMAAHTAAPVESRLPVILGELGRIPGVLIVLNHPFWLEEGVEQADHGRALDRVLRQSNHLFHAFELNGTRRWGVLRRVCRRGPFRPQRGALHAALPEVPAGPHIGIRLGRTSALSRVSRPRALDRPHLLPRRGWRRHAAFDPVETPHAVGR
jgi:hypothetical protein